MDAALALKAEHDVDPGQIARIEGETFAEAARLATRRPETTEQAQYSLPFPVAAAVVCGRLGVDEITNNMLDDLQIRRLSGGMVVIADTVLSAHFPERRVARVRFLLSNRQHPRRRRDRSVR